MKEAAYWMVLGALLYGAACGFLLGLVLLSIKGQHWIQEAWARWSARRAARRQQRAARAQSQSLAGVLRRMK